MKTVFAKINKSIVADVSAAIHPPRYIDTQVKGCVSQAVANVCDRVNGPVNNTVEDAICVDTLWRLT
jgi:hypothetical protein